MGQMALHCYISAYRAPELPLLFMLMSHAHLKIHPCFQFHFLAPTKSCMPESFETNIWARAGLTRKPVIGTRSSLGWAGTRDQTCSHQLIQYAKGHFPLPFHHFRSPFLPYTVTNFWVFPYLTDTPGARQCEDATMCPRGALASPIFAVQECWAFIEPCPVEEGRVRGRPGIWKFHTMSFHTIHSIAAFNRVARPHRRSPHHGGHV
jgi:hypothetical protein